VKHAQNISNLFLSVAVYATVFHALIFLKLFLSFSCYEYHKFTLTRNKSKRSLKSIAECTQAFIKASSWNHESKGYAEEFEILVASRIFANICKGA